MSEPKPRRKIKHWKIVVLSFLVILIIVRLILPYLMLNYANKTLAGLKGYYGHIEDIDVALIRGAYKVNNLLIVKLDTISQQKDTIPFFKTPIIYISIEWRALFKGAIRGEVEMNDPVLNFVKGKHKNENIKEDTTSFKQVFRKLTLLTINHFKARNGQIHFIDLYSSPQIDMAIKNIQVEAFNLSNVNDSVKVLPSSLKAKADVYDGHLRINVKLNALAEKPTFDLNAGLDDVNMIYLNNFFKAYGKFEVEKGTFGLYTEFAAKDGLFNGYVKPLIKDVKVKKEGNIAQIAWQTLVGGVEALLENNKTDKAATKLPIKGHFDDPKAGLWTAISYVLKNAFVFALKSSIDNTIDIGKVEPVPEKKTLMQKVFGKSDKKKKKQ